MPCRHGPRPTAWWRPTAPCSISMCGRFCGASMPRSTQASSGSRRNRCLTYPSWRLRKTSSENTKTRRRKQGLRQGRPCPPLHSSRLHRRKGRRSLRRTGERRLALHNLRSLHKCGAVSASGAAVTAAAAASAAAMAAAAKRGAPRAIANAASAAAAAAPQPTRIGARGKDPGRPATASSQARSHATRRPPARGQAAAEGLAMESACEMGRGDTGRFGYRRRTVDVACQARSARLRQRSRRARRQIEGRANRPQRSAEPKGRSPSRPLIASPDLLNSST